MKLPEKRKLRIFTRKLLKWSGKHLRDYPWRRTGDPYRILIAELMLRRTRADQVLRVYSFFMRRFPGLTHFLESSTKELLAILKPLGLRWRAKNFVALRRYLGKHGITALPVSYDRLVAMPGIGDYVARAVINLSGRFPVYVVDANVIRLVCRFFGYRFNPELRRKRWFREIMEAVTPREKTREFVLATLDLPATVCLPKRPKCEVCPLFQECFYRRRSYSGA